MKIHLKVKKIWQIGRGHYQYNGTKTTMNSEPKRLRTRQAQTKAWKKEYE